MVNPTLARPALKDINSMLSPDNVSLATTLAHQDV
jgi:hypothetical protein